MAKIVDNFVVDLVTDGHNMPGRLEVDSSGRELGEHISGG